MPSLVFHRDPARARELREQLSWLNSTPLTPRLARVRAAVVRELAELEPRQVGVVCGHPIYSAIIPLTRKTDA